MIKYEIKKVFYGYRNKLAVIFLIIFLIITSILTINRVEYVDAQGNSSVGISAARNLRAEKNKWSGYVTEDVLQKVILENRKINNSKQAKSDDIRQQNMAYAKKQGFWGIAHIINSAFSEYRDYNYFAIDNLSAADAKKVYSKRISGLEKYLDSGKESFTPSEQKFLLDRYTNLKTPFYYEYCDNWEALLQNISTFILILALLIGFIISGILSDEFQNKSDSVFFSTKLGRNKAILSKIFTGFLITTFFYIVFILLYTLLVLSVLGFDGANCPIQLNLWRSVYNITFFQAYLMITAGGYIGTLFSAGIAMLVSALSRSSTAAAVMPFIILCAFPFLSRVITLPQICSFFPDQLMEIYIDIKESGLITLGGKVTTIACVIMPVYAAAALILQPVLYFVYRRAEVK